MKQAKREQVRLAEMAGFDEREAKPYVQRRINGPKHRIVPKGRS